MLSAVNATPFTTGALSVGTFFYSCSVPGHCVGSAGGLGGSGPRAPGSEGGRAGQLDRSCPPACSPLDLGAGQIVKVVVKVCAGRRLLDNE